jgi:transposase
MTAPCVVDGSMNGKTFLAYVEQSLAPTLKRNDMVIMDNLPARKVPGVQQAIEAQGRDTSLPAQYSPENPIEMPFRKLKAYLVRPRSGPFRVCVRRMGSFARHLSAAEALNYFRHDVKSTRIRSR